MVPHAREIYERDHVLLRPDLHVAKLAARVTGIFDRAHHPAAPGIVLLGLPPSSQRELCEEWMIDLFATFGCGPCNETAIFAPSEGPMAIPQEALTAAPEQQVATADRSESVRSLILAAVGWWLLAELSSIPVGIVMSIMRHAGVPDASFENPVGGTVMVILTSGILLIADRKRSGIVGHGNHRAGVDDRPIMRWGLLVVLALLAATWSFFASAVWNDLAPQWAASWRQASPWTVGVFALVTVVVTPFAEELFFRGWLWTALRRHWRAFPTALLTGVLWLATHLELSLVLPLFLLPTAIILGFARHFCGIRAAIVVHMIYNFAVTLFLLTLLAAKH